MSIKNISIVSNCTGCSACNEICPKKAIQMRPNEEGFLYPHVNDSLCNNCGLCAKRCPAINPTFDNTKEPICIAAASKQNRIESSSGGIFFLLAKEILKQGGFVCGAAWNKNMEVEHIIISSLQDFMNE